MPGLEAFNNQPEKIEYFPDGRFVVSLFSASSVRIIRLFSASRIILITIYPQSPLVHNEKQSLIKNPVQDGLQNVDCLKLQI